VRRRTLRHAVLEAVTQAGGFTPFAFTKHLKVFRIEGTAEENTTVTAFRLIGHFRPAPGAKHPLVWYWPDKPGSSPPVDLQTDFELKDGDELLVDRVFRPRACIQTKLRSSGRP
jgi:hypothetical protein